MKKTITLWMLCLASILSNAQAPVLLKNINPNTVDNFSSSFPGKGIVFNGHLYFAATDYNGRELWRSDGTSGGTSLVRDIESLFSGGDSDPQFFNMIGNNLYFFANDFGVKIYKIDGTTHALSEVASLQDSFPTEVVVVGTDLFFAGINDYSEGEELLRFYTGSDYVETVEDINYGSDPSRPRDLTVKGDTLFFSADDGDGRELWMYDYENDELNFVADINSSGSSDPHDFIIFNNKVFFTADDGINGMELWESDGDEFGTQMVSNINPTPGDGSDPLHKTIFYGQIYFSADGDGSPIGRELWRYNDNTGVSQLVMNINTNFGGDSDPGQFGFLQVGSNLFFAADDGMTGVELWKTNGTSTSRVMDIHPFGSSNPQDMISFDNTLFFVAGNATNGREIWKSDGTTTTMLKDIQPVDYDAPQIVGIHNNRLFFYANDNVTGSELYSTDGSSAGTSLVQDINLGNYSIGSNPGALEFYKGSLFFSAKTEAYSNAGLLKTDGTAAGTVVVKAGAGTPNDFFANSNEMKKAGSLLYFSGRTTADGTELWKSDSTEAGTMLVKDINTGNESSSPRNMIEFGSSLIFTAYTPANGEELWISDGTEVGTTMLKDIRPGTSSSGIDNLSVLNGKLVFTANDGTNGDEIWVSDGTTGGTVMLADINSGSGGSFPDNFSLISGIIGSYLYFSANDQTHGKEMWRTDGTPGNTILFKDINTGAGSSNPGDYAALNGFIYFAASSSGGNSSLWRSDGTIGNGSQFDPIRFPLRMTTVGSRIIFFSVPTGSPGFELWSTDGTTTSQIENFANNGSSGLDYLVGGNAFTFLNKLFFWVDDKVHGVELWQSDGTQAGTFLFDIAPGPHSSYPNKLNGLDKLIFAANAGDNVGVELYTLDVCGSTPDISTWIGIADTDWNNASNWCGGVPNPNSNVGILNSAPYMPSISTGSITINNLNIKPDATINLIGGTFTINGIIQGEGKLSGTQNASLAIGGNAGSIWFSDTANIIKNLTVMTSASVTLGNTLQIATGSTPGVLTLQDGSTLHANDNLVLLSDNTGTARVASISENGGGNALTTITGKVKVERYIGAPAAKRAWRLLTAPLAGNTSDVSIFDTWQLGGIIGAEGIGKGTLITSPSANGSNGLDAVSGYSLKQYDGTNLVGVDNTHTTPLLTSGQSAANQSYFIFVRGDRSNSSLAGTANTKLCADGFLQTGKQTFATNAAANSITLIGNPYASPVDFDLLRQANTSSNIKPNFYFWDPNLNMVGSYVTVSYDGVGDGYTITPSGADRTRYIQSGQAFFVQTNMTGSGTASIDFHENQKVANTVNNVFRTGSQLEKLEILLHIMNTNGTGETLVDGVVGKYHNSFSTNVGNEDAQKIMNIDESLAFTRNGTLLSIEGRPLIDDMDTLFLSMTNIKLGRTYQFTINPTQFNAPQLAAWLIDNYLNTATPIGLDNQTQVSFITTSDPATYATDRFKIVFGLQGTLPVSTLSIKAFAKDNGIQVNWTNYAEANVQHYTVEKSIDGRTFTGTETIPAKANNLQQVDYNWYDANPVNGYNYYRIKATDTRGATQYTTIVKVKMGDEFPFVSIYPNPVKDKVVNVQFMQQPAGKYQLALFSSLGQKIFDRSIYHTGGQATQSVSLNGVAPGVYQLRISGSETAKTFKIVIE